MSLRYYAERINAGYGVTNFETDNTNADIEFSILSILLRDLPGNIRIETRGDDPEPFLKIGIECAWKLSLQIINVNNEELQIFNGRSGKSKYGTYVCGLEQYFVDEQFINYLNIQSSIYNCTYVLDLPNYELDGIPCNEPPLDLISPPVPDGEIFWSTESFSIPIRASTRNVISDSSLIGADSMFVYLEPAVKTWLAGITYAFTVTGFTERDLENGPPIYVLF